MSPAQQTVLIVFGILAGFAVGSFACVVIERMPVMLDEPKHGDLWDTRPWGEVLGGHSRCSSCGNPIRPVDKIPFLSWLVLRGKCRNCDERIPAFHPLVELAVPAIGVLVVLAYGWGWRVVPVLWLVPVAVVIAAIDLRTYIVPTRVVWPAFGVSVVLSVIAALVEGEPVWLLGGVVGALTLCVPLGLIWFAMPSGMGFGDVRLVVLLGWTVGFAAVDVGRGWITALFVAVIALALSAVTGIVFSLIGVTARGRQAKVPFGPSLVLGALVCIMFATEILDFFELT